MFLVNKVHSITTLTFLCIVGVIYNDTLGTLAALLFLVAGMTITFLQRRFLFSAIRQNLLLIMIPFLAALSFSWSTVPAISLRGGIQLLLTTIIAVMIAYSITFRRLILILAIASFSTMTLSFTSDNYVINGMTGDYNLVGIFGSKNFLSMNSSLSIAVGISLFCLKDVAKKWNIFGLVLVIISSLVLVKTRSLGSLITTFTAVVIVLLISQYHKFKLSKWIKSNLNIIFYVVTFSCILFFFIFIQMPEFGNLMYSLGKDPTLTGRTFIWERGVESILMDPILGKGFQGIFYVGNPLSEEIWEFANVESGAGFNFHNMYIDISVQLGVLSLILFINMIWCFLKSILNSKDLSLGKREGFASMVFFYMFLQTFLEAGWFSQFTISHVLICISWIYLVTQKRISVVKIRW